MEQPIPRHIQLTSHPENAGRANVPLNWGAATPAARGPVVASPAEPRASQRDRLLLRLLCGLPRAGGRDPRAGPDHRPDLTDTAPVALIGAAAAMGRPA